MKKVLFAVLLLLLTQAVFAQTDSTQNKSTDTLVAGNFIIIKKPKKSLKLEVGTKNGIDVTYNSGKWKNKNVSTNWWIFDLGFANFRDNTNYADAQAGPYLRTLNTAAGAVNKNSMSLITGKSSNVNIWFFMQRVNISKHVLNLKYGLGTESYNFRYDSRVSFRKDAAGSFVFNDSISFSKNKLFAAYLTMPLMININATPNKPRGFNFSAGVSAGYLFKSRNKQISDERGKIKYNGNFDLQPWRLAAIGEISLGSIRLYGSYSLNALHKTETRLEQYPYSIGIRFSNW